MIIVAAQHPLAKSKTQMQVIVRGLSFKKSNFCDVLDKSLKLFLVIHMNISIQKK